MAISLLELPRNASGRIFGFLDPETTVRMRKVSKSIKEFIDESTLRTQTPDIEHIFLRGDNNQDTKLIFIFSHWWDSRMWRNYIRSISDKLEIKILKLKDEHHLTMDNLYFTAKSTGMLQFLEYLSHRVCNVKVESIHISSNDPETIRVTGEFLAGRSVKTLRLGDMVLTKTDLANYFDLVKQVNPDSFHYTLEGQKLVNDEVDFLLRISETVKYVFLCHICDCDDDDDEIDNDHPNFMKIITSMLRRSCGKIGIVEECPSIRLSLSDIEQFLQFLQHSEKKLSLRFRNLEMESIHVQIGHYSIVSDVAEAKLTIKHVHF